MPELSVAHGPALSPPSFGREWTAIRAAESHACCYPNPRGWMSRWVHLLEGNPDPDLVAQARSDKRRRDGEHVESRTWHVRFKDHTGKWRRLTAYSDKVASERFGSKLSDLADLRAADERPDREPAGVGRQPRRRGAGQAVDPTAPSICISYSCFSYTS